MEDRKLRACIDLVIKIWRTKRTEDERLEDRKVRTCIDLGIKIRRIKRTEDLIVWKI